MKRHVDIRWVRRTFTRVQWACRHLDAHQLADVLVATGTDSKAAALIGASGAFLEDVAEAILHQHPLRHQACLVCGTPCRTFSRPDARYCSATCRQRAYRKRVTARGQDIPQTRHTLLDDEPPSPSPPATS